MARKASKKGKKQQKRRYGLWAFAAIAALMVATLGCGAVNASYVRVRRAEVQVNRLPAQFDGVSLLYISDIDLCGTNTAKKAAVLVNRLQQLRPDALILGGDYTSASLWETLDRQSDTGLSDARKLERRSFFHYICDFSAPLGKFALIAPEDDDPAQLGEDMMRGGFTPMYDSIAKLEKDGASVWLAGLTSGSLPKSLKNIGASDCAIAVTVSPELFPTLFTLEAAGGGQLFDLALAGHTHGGQIRLGNRTVLSLTSHETRYLSGWTREAGVPALTTSGLGCEGLNIRIGSAPEVWLITLRCEQTGE